MNIIISIKSNIDIDKKEDFKAFVKEDIIEKINKHYEWKILDHEFKFEVEVLEVKENQIIKFIW